MSKEQLIKYFQTLFLYIGTKKKDLVEVLLKLRGDFFHLLLNEYLLSLLLCANKRLLAMNTNMNKILPFILNWLSLLNMFWLSKMLFQPYKYQEIGYFNRNYKGFLLKSILQRELIYFTFQSGHF